MIRITGLRQKITSGLLVVLLVVGSLWTKGWAQMTQVTLGVGFVGARLAPLWIAEKEGLFRKNGIDPKLINLPGAAQGVPALLSGEVDLCYMGAASTIPAIAEGAQLVEVMANTSVIPYLLMTSADVKTSAELKGKRMASSGMGVTPSRLAMLVAFERLGLNAERDRIGLVAVGSEPERIAGVASGALAGTVISPEFRSKAEQLGLQLLADLRTMNIPWEHDVMETSRKNLQTKRDVIERILKAQLEGNAYVLNPARRSAVSDLLTSRLGFKTAQEASAAYEDLVKYYIRKKPYPNKEGLLSIIAEVGKIVPKAANLKYENVADPSIVEKLDKSGFIDSLYK